MVKLFCTNIIIFVTKFYQACFSQELSNQNEVINMNETLKGWPFEPLKGKEADPLGEGGPGAGPGPT